MQDTSITWSSAGYITVTMKPWVDKIKENGNDAAHEIRTPNLNRTKSTLKFTMFLLKNVYENGIRSARDFQL